MNKKQVQAWYEEAIGDFDQEQSIIIEKLVENYNPPIESEDNTESREDTFDYIKKDVVEKQANIKKEFINMEKSIQYLLRKMSYEIESDRIHINNKLCDLMGEPENVIPLTPNKPKKPTCMLDERMFEFSGRSEADEDDDEDSPF